MINRILTAVLFALLIAHGALAQTVTVAQPTGTNLHAVIDSGAVTASGTVTANIQDSAANAIVGIESAVSSGTGDLAIVVAPVKLGLAATSTAFTSTLGATLFAVSATPANLYGVTYYNPAATVCFLQLFDATTGNVSLGSTVAVEVIPMPTVSANAPVNSPIPLRNYATAISAASTTSPTNATPCGTVSIVEFRFKN